MYINELKRFVVNCISLIPLILLICIKSQFLICIHIIYAVDMKITLSGRTSTAYFLNGISEVIDYSAYEILCIIYLLHWLDVFVITRNLFVNSK